MRALVALSMRLRLNPQSRAPNNPGTGAAHRQSALTKGCKSMNPNDRDALGLALTRQRAHSDPGRRWQIEVDAEKPVGRSRALRQLQPAAIAALETGGQEPPCDGDKNGPDTASKPFARSKCVALHQPLSSYPIETHRNRPRRRLHHADDRRLFLDLLQRFNRLGAQFPHEADIRNAATRASAISSAKLCSPK